MSNPIIGIVGATSIFNAGNFHISEKYYINSSYLNAVQKHKGIPLPIPLLKDEGDLQKLLSLCDGLLLPGGEDVDPEYYSENPHYNLGVIRPELDALAFKCLDYAKEHNLPVFGICRGSQVLNIAFGGTLYQDIKSQYEKECIMHAQTYNRSYTVHHVDIVSGTLLSEILGEKTVKVNTMHHQSVKDLGKGLKVSAYAPDGIVEAIENDEGTMFAVQWHPEELLDSAPVMNNLFAKFIEMARKH